MKIVEEIKKKGKKPESVPIKPPKFAERKLPSTIEAIDKQIKKIETQLEELEGQKNIKDKNKSVALGTSKINYLDPRITFSFCEKFDLPVSKVFSKTLKDKFPWAVDAKDFNF
jgi:DNA topoisomerase I